METWNLSQGETTPSVLGNAYPDFIPTPGPRLPLVLGNKLFHVPTAETLCANFLIENTFVP